MRTEEFKVYQFEELPIEAQGKVLEQFRDFNVDHDWWDFIYEDADRIAEILGIEIRRKSVGLYGGGTRKDPAIWFSGFYCQGDGARFEGFYSYAKGSTKKIREYAPQDEDLHRIADRLFQVQRRNFFQLYAVVELGYGHGEHEMNTRIAVEHKEQDFITDGAEDEIKDCLRDFMRWIFRTLREEYEYQTSDERVTETIEANAYEFFEDGRMV